MASWYGVHWTYKARSLREASGIWGVCSIGTPRALPPVIDSLVLPGPTPSDRPSSGVTSRFIRGTSRALWPRGGAAGTPVASRFVPRLVADRVDSLRTDESWGAPPLSHGDYAELERRDRRQWGKRVSMSLRPGVAASRGSRQPLPSANGSTSETGDDRNRRLSGAMQGPLALRSGGAI